MLTIIGPAALLGSNKSEPQKRKREFLNTIGRKQINLLSHLEAASGSQISAGLLFELDP